LARRRFETGRKCWLELNEGGVVEVHL
jgi:hypothetical protein